MKPNKKEELKDLRKTIVLGMKEVKELCSKFKNSSVPKPEYLFQLGKDESKTRIAKMIEVLRRNDPQFEVILRRHLFTKETIITE